jgi:hypothetical protein
MAAQSPAEQERYLFISRSCKMLSLQQRITKIEIRKVPRSAGSGPSLKGPDKYVDFVFAQFNRKDFAHFTCSI